MSELNILIPDEKIKLREIEIMMRPCKVRELKHILSIVSRYVDKLAETEDTFELAKYLLGDSGEQGLKDVYTILFTCSDVSGEETFDELLYDELTLLIVKFLEMNKDFFKRIGEKLNPPKQEEVSQNSKKIGASK